MTLSTSRILLKKGVLLIHDKDGNVNPVRSDLLVEGDKIVQISDDIEASGDHVKVFDCEGKVISPGFISTHHHVWQTALKGRHANHSLLEYLPTGSYAGALYSADDAFWGELGGALEAIDGGTTTVVDHSSLNVGPEYPPTMIQALAASGLRAVYCYCVPTVVSSWSPLTWQDDYTSPDVLVPWKSLASNGPYGDGRIQLGFAVDNVHQSPDEMKKLYSELRAAKAKVITSHSAGGLAYGNGPSVAQLLEGHGLLGPDILVSHAISPRDGDAGLFAKRDAHISSTPNTELQAGAPPVCLRPEFEAQSSLGVDCHSWGSSFMPSQMRLGLQHARTERCADLGRQGKWSRHVGPSAEQVFNLATIGGARAIGMAGEVGQIRVGAKADLVIFDTGSPSMLPAAEEDPVAAIVLHSSERDVETVIVGGVIRKEDGKLMPVSVAHEVPGAIDLGLVGKEITWKDVAKELLESRKRLNEKVEGIDMKAAEEVVITNFYMNRKDMVEQA
ncbi:amidohydrolase [Colletotrichum higginsianum]|uniref:Amidohydrolase n=2 Tax=Colletotrichum higginsianum TaxID=80884 RepID=H1VJD8_COLHI|nr:Amidohydrolase [Colletotrichum higginsianum IMI 349063]OBR12829.1 Amidohydrolase [Colletotrichum higginsianum IMI 349063]TID00159.1 5-methylthioadenosine/S-adenosylhomocysteine deaminase [Colletotrichum higginsianum]CCF40341.1 amidohydrolase [Colletotrichum higginsianum]